jgi:hypothetical protein
VQKRLRDVAESCPLCPIHTHSHYALTSGRTLAAEKGFARLLTILPANKPKGWRLPSSGILLFGLCENNGNDSYARMQEPALRVVTCNVVKKRA